MIIIIIQSYTILEKCTWASESTSAGHRLRMPALTSFVDQQVRMAAWSGLWMCVIMLMDFISSQMFLYLKLQLFGSWMYFFIQVNNGRTGACSAEHTLS